MDESKNEKMTSLAGASSEEIARAIADVLDSMKARDIKLLRVSDKTVMTDYFVICSGTSNTQIKALSGEVEYKLGERGVSPLHIEGYETGTWIAMDYAHVMVHIFNREQRDFYKLKKLWGDACEVPLNTENSEQED